MLWQLYHSSGELNVIHILAVIQALNYILVGGIETYSINEAFGTH